MSLSAHARRLLDIYEQAVRATETGRVTDDEWRDLVQARQELEEYMTKLEMMQNDA